MLGVLFPSELEMREAGDRGVDDTNDLKLAVVAVFTPWCWRTLCQHPLTESPYSMALHLLQFKAQTYRPDFKPPFTVQKALGAETKSAIVTRQQHTAPDWCCGDSGERSQGAQASSPKLQGNSVCCVLRTGFPLVNSPHEVWWDLHKNPPQENSLGGDGYVHGLYGGDGFTGTYPQTHCNVYIQYVSFLYVNCTSLNWF